MSVTGLADKSAAAYVTGQLLLLLICQAAAERGVKICVCACERGETDGWRMVAVAMTRSQSDWVRVSDLYDRQLALSLLPSCTTD